MRILKAVWAFFKSKYVLTVLALAVWLLFFDKNDLFSQYDLRQQVKKLEDESAYFKNEIDNNKKEQAELQSDPHLLEKFAREHYLMKKDSEDIFVIVADTLK